MRDSLGCIAVLPILYFVVFWTCIYVYGHVFLFMCFYALYEHVSYLWHLLLFSGMDMCMVVYYLCYLPIPEYPFIICMC